MTAHDRNFDELLNVIERREKAAKRRALVWTLLPAVAAVALLGYSSWRLGVESTQVALLTRQADSLQKTVDDRETEIKQLQDRIKTLQQKLSDTQALLRDTVELAKYRHPVDFVDLKVIYSRYPRQARVLEEILNLRRQGVKWKLGGQQPAEGFDSPSFAAYILRKANGSRGKACSNPAAGFTSACPRPAVRRSATWCSIPQAMRCSILKTSAASRS